MACYQTFIRGLLDLTDNIVGGEIVPPPGVVRYDGDDPYLVVAADKGTATFSDIANAIAVEYGFWLGDAFASGGSNGYDHKKMGITARGAWESRRSATSASSGSDIQSEDFTVVGIGDMAATCSATGCCCRAHIRLVAAFNHRHVFLDPDPDPRASASRSASGCSTLPRSTWDDYDRDADLGGRRRVRRARAKSIPLSPAGARGARRSRTRRCTPNELIQAILRAPVDLLWNGGIGTYVKAQHRDARRRRRQGQRRRARRRHRAARARWSARAATSAFTQRGADRVRARAAGGINTDAIDNSGGVDCSDHEVNIKILLDAVVEAGDLTEKQRNELLEEMTDEVAALVLQDNYEQTRDAQPRRGERGEHGRRPPALPALPRDAPQPRPRARGAAGRRGDRRAQARPRRASPGPSSRCCSPTARSTSTRRCSTPTCPRTRTCPRSSSATSRRRCPSASATQMREHRLRREIIATQVVNNMLHGGGTTFAFRLHEETGAPASQIARAYACRARDLRDAAAVGGDRGSSTASATADGPDRPAARGPAARRARVALAARQPAAARSTSPRPCATSARARWRCTRRSRGCSRPRTPSRSRGAPTSCASRACRRTWPRAWRRCRSCSRRSTSSTVADESELDVDHVAAVHFRLGSRLGLHWLRDRIVALPRDDRWRARARAALRDDLYAIHRELTSEVLRRPPPTASRTVSSTAGSTRTRPPSERCRRSATSGAARATT